MTAEAYGTTAAEQMEGEPLEDRLAAEEPDVDQDPGAATGVPEEEAGLLADDPWPGLPREQDVFSHREKAVEGLSAEETAVHVHGEEDRDGGSGRA